jgi:hypothetical protein
LAASPEGCAQEKLAPDEQAAVNARAYPWTTWGAEQAPGLALFGPGRGAQIGARALTGGIFGAGEAAGEYVREGEFDPAKIAASVGASIAERFAPVGRVRNRPPRRPARP